MKTTAFIRAAFFLNLLMLCTARGDPLTVAEVFGVNDNETTSNGRIDNEVNQELSPEQLLLKEAQASRLREIPGLEVEFDGRGIPTRLSGQLGYYRGDAPHPDAELARLFRDLGPVYRAAGTEQLEQFSGHVDEVGIGSYRIDQYIDDLPVHGGGLIIITDSHTDEILRIKGSFLPDRGLPQSPHVSAGEAAEIAAEAIAARDNIELQSFDVNEKPELVYYLEGNLAWRFYLDYQPEGRVPETEMVVLDAVNGSLIESANVLVPILNRQIIDDKGMQTADDDVVQAPIVASDHRKQL